MIKLGWITPTLALVSGGPGLGGCSQGDQGRSQEVQELLLLEYESGKREFVSLRLEGADLQGQDLRWINFVQADLR